MKVYTKHAHVKHADRPQPMRFKEARFTSPFVCAVRDCSVETILVAAVMEADSAAATSGSKNIADSSSSGEKKIADAADFC